MRKEDRCYIYQFLILSSIYGKHVYYYLLLVFLSTLSSRFSIKRLWYVFEQVNANPKWQIYWNICWLQALKNSWIVPNWLCCMLHTQTWCEFEPTKCAKVYQWTCYLLSEFFSSQCRAQINRFWNGSSADQTAHTLSLTHTHANTHTLSFLHSHTHTHTHFVSKTNSHTHYLSHMWLSPFFMDASLTLTLSH